MATLSWPTFLIMVAAIAVDCVSQFDARDHGMRGFQQARELEDELQRTHRDISEGAKELRISRPRRHAIFHGRLKGTAASIRDIQIRSINLFTIANVLGSSLFFVVIGLALAYQFFWPDVDRTTLSGVVLVLLYVKGPLEHVIGDLPIVTRAQVAFSRIADLSRQFESLEPHVAVHPGGPAASEMQSIGLKGVRYAFPAGDGEPFVPGPVDLCLEQGESVFIVGDNGSGKTTLIKLLLGLYAPQAGEVLLDGAPETEATRDDYRQLFTTIFADYHLFEDLPPGGGRAASRGGALPATARAGA